MTNSHGMGFGGAVTHQKVGEWPRLSALRPCRVSFDEQFGGEE